MKYSRQQAHRVLHSNGNLSSNRMPGTWTQDPTNTKPHCPSTRNELQDRREDPVSLTAIMNPALRYFAIFQARCSSVCLLSPKSFVRGLMVTCRTFWFSEAFRQLLELRGLGNSSTQTPTWVSTTQIWRDAVFITHQLVHWATISFDDSRSPWSNATWLYALQRFIHYLLAAFRCDQRVNSDLWNHSVLISLSAGSGITMLHPLLNDIYSRKEATGSTSDIPFWEMMCHLVRERPDMILYF